MRTVVCIPTYCEHENLGPLVEDILSSVEDVDVMIIDGDSSDGTGELGDELASRHQRVVSVRRTKKGTLANSLIEGFRRALEAGYDQVIQMDADLSHQPQFLPSLLEVLERKDVVIGSRYVEGGGVDHWSLARRVASRAGNAYTSRVLDMPYADVTSGFVGFKRHVLEAVDFEELDGEGRAIQIELKYRAYRLGFEIAEVPIHFWDRVVGTSKLTPVSAVGTLVSVLGVRLKGD